MANRQVYLTTADNPYDPKTQFEQWYAYDTMKGYNTPGYLARRAHTSDGISDEDNALELEDAIDAIISVNALGLYKKIVYEDNKLVKNS